MFNQKQMFRRVVIVGVGMMGASLGLAIKKRGLAKEVIGVGRHETSLREAADLGAIDESTMDLKKGIIGADLIVLATPVNTILDNIDILAKECRRGCMITDLGSTKAAIVDRAEKNLPHSILYVGSHPLVGSEKRGPVFANAQLFEGGVVIMTPTDKTNRLARDKMKQFWTMLGAQVKLMSPLQHDEILGFTSHLPHLIAFSMVKAMPEAYLEHVAQGFKDTTRIAASDPTLWVDVSLSNHKNVLKSLDETVKVIAQIRKNIVANDREALMEVFKQAKIKRDQLDKSHAS